ncbi:MAG TPA: hypothetical protein VMU28_00500 [Terriglobales bacterium]|nr:hypothetical protein [Terriglobales bacterium]
MAWQTEQRWFVLVSRRLLQIAACLFLFTTLLSAQSGSDSDQETTNSVAAAAARTRKVRETQSGQKPEKLAVTDAERRQRFEAAKQSIENSQSESSVSAMVEAGTASKANSNVMLSPIQAAMLIGEQRGFSLLTNDNRHVEREADWTSSNSSVVEVVDKARIVAKAEGTAVIRAYIQGQEMQASVKVYPGNSLPQGTAIWTAPVGGTGRPQIVPAIPH